MKIAVIGSATDVAATVQALAPHVGDKVDLIPSTIRKEKGDHMGQLTEGGNYVDPEGGLYVSRSDLEKTGLVPKQTGDVKTHMTQSQAGLGVQGSRQNMRQIEQVLPPTHPDMPDA